MSRSILVFGGSGFVGSAICKYALSQNIQVTTISRSGQPRLSEPWQSGITYLKGDALDQSSYAHLLPSFSAVVHSIGTLIDSRTPLNIRNTYQGSYEHMNRDTALKVCQCLESKNIPFVFISAERGMFFSPRYLSTKREVEDYLAANRDKLPSAVIRPGFMYSSERTDLSLIATGIDILHLPDGILQGMGVKWFAETFVPAKSISVDLVAKVAVMSCFEKALLNKTFDNKDIEAAAKEFDFK
jgi:nucleoside-diphosphate-sugar epimerase